MKTLLTLFVLTATTLSTTAQTATDELNEILVSTQLICDAIDEAQDAVNDFMLQVEMGTATTADATNFRNRITAAMGTVEEQQDEIQASIFAAAGFDNSIDPTVIAGLAAEIEGLEDAVQNESDAALISFNAGDVNKTLVDLKKVRNALKIQKNRTEQVVNRVNQELAKQ